MLHNEKLQLGNLNNEVTHQNYVVNLYKCQIKVIQIINSLHYASVIGIT